LMKNTEVCNHKTYSLSLKVTASEIWWLKSSIKLIQDDGLNLQIYFFTILD
jgi:hypothetical protein